MVITATHASYLDPLLVSVALFPLSISYMAKQELFGWTPMGLFVWSMGTFPVNRQKVAKSTIQTALSVLKSKVWHLGIFPQGGRRQGVESIGALKAGAAFFSRKAQAPILPLVVCQSPDNPRRLHVAIGALIDPQGNTEEIALRLQARLNDLLLQAQEKIATDAKS
jgi:1-acyl-sn-glycerol-3-phosphate acyltransferase